MFSSNKRHEDNLMDTNTASTDTTGRTDRYDTAPGSTTTTGGMQSSNYPNHQPGTTRNTLKKPSPANQTNAGLGTTGGNTGYPVDNTNNYTNEYSSMPPTSTAGATAGTFPSSTATTNNNNTTSTFPPTSATATSTSPTYPDIKQAKKEERVGKIETKVGKIFHSSNMLAKGEAHLETAAALTTQHSSLQEAEALEREAKVHRDRANAHKMAAEAITGTGGEQGPGRYDGISGSHA